MKQKSREFQYEALRYTQRPGARVPEFVLFHASAGEIRQWADVDRLDPVNPSGAQRPLRPLKVNKVARFLGKELNTIPTAIIVALEKPRTRFSIKGRATAAGRSGVLTIRLRGNKKPGLIIDGQHRVYGADKHSGDMHLNVVAFLGGDDTEAAFQFVVINNTAQRVSKDHIKALSLNYKEEELNKRLMDSAGLGLKDTTYEDLQVIDMDPPFKGLINWLRNADGFIPANAVESGMAETRDRAARLGIEGLERDVFLALWSTVKATRLDQWKKYPDSRLLQKVSIYALTVFILDNMISAQTVSDVPIDFADDKTLEQFVEKLVKQIPAEFWTAEWTLTELDTRGGREAVIRELQVITSNIRHGRPWYDSLSIIDPSTLAESHQASTKPKHRRAARKK